MTKLSSRNVQFADHLGLVYFIDILWMLIYT